MSIGYYAMARGWMNHDALKEPKFSKREAWCWLIENAAWKDHKIVWRCQVIEINRGQVPISIRNLSEIWGWSINKVQRFLDVLKTDTMVDTRTDTPFSVIIICNYEEYQSELKETDTQTNTATDTQTNTNRRIAKKEEIRKEVNIPPNDKNQKNLDIFVLPDWMPLPEWDDYKEMRKKKKNPMTARAETLAIKHLKELKDAGGDIKKIIEQSVFRGWSGFWDPRDKQKKNNQESEKIPHHLKTANYKVL